MKHSKVEACIICDDVPCSCYAKKPKPRARKPVSATQDFVNEIVGAPPIVRDWGKAKKAEAPDSGLDFETEQAIRNLADAGLLTETDKARYRNVIKPTPSPEVDRRLADWKKRNDLGRLSSP